LQEDLTYYFENPAEAPSGAISPGGGGALDRVTWEQLQSFYQLGYERSGDTITARAQEADSHGVYPLLVMLHMNFGFTVENNYAAGTPSDPAERNYQVYGHMRPWFVLANPYNTELSVSNYRIRFNQYTAARLQISYQQSGVGVTDLIDESMDDYLKNLVFVVPEVPLEAGEALYFTLDTTDHASYGYSFTAGSGGFYAPYQGYATNTPQQFVFTAADDAGLTSIRMQNAGTVTGDLSEDGGSTLAEASSASTMPGWVLQGDLLQALAPGLSVRSDTFTIRAYGSVLDPVSGKLSAEAYVEAVVQRSPEYVDTNDAPAASAALGTLSASNQLAGRKFTVVDIRFLDESSL
tara:strand:+ start:1575 stop:2624 length:1050 start_codon:yes stop_codon:yes gene_type:complete